MFRKRPFGSVDDDPDESPEVVLRWGADAEVAGSCPGPGDGPWGPLLAGLSGVPPVADRNGPRLSSRVTATAGFRDEFYALAEAARDPGGARLVGGRPPAGHGRDDRSGPRQLGFDGTPARGESDGLAAVRRGRLLEKCRGPSGGVGVKTVGAEGSRGHADEGHRGRRRSGRNRHPGDADDQRRADRSRRARHRRTDRPPGSRRRREQPAGHRRRYQRPHPNRRHHRARARVVNAAIEVL